MLEKFDNYGNDAKVYAACAEPIRHSNVQHALIISWWFLLVNVLYLVCAQFEWLNVEPAGKPLYVAYIVVIGVYIAIVRLSPRFRRIKQVPTIVNIAILVSYGIVVSNAAPYTIGFMFLIIMLVVATSYITTVSRMVVILVASAGLFIYFSYTQKPLSVSYQDISNTIIILGISLLLHYPFQDMRVRQFVINNENKKIQRELEVESSFDTMTSLFNRSTFFALGEKALRERAGFMALCIIDLDEFKQINDELGHQVGDQAIRMAADAILESLQVDVADAWEYKRSVLKEGGSFAGRLGGDEFVVLVRDKASMDEVCVQMQGLLDRLNSLDEGEIHGLYASVGVTEIVQGELDVDSAYKRSDAALYGAKRSGKNQIGRG